MKIKLHTLQCYGTSVVRLASSGNATAEADNATAYDMAYDTEIFNNVHT